MTGSASSSIASLSLAMANLRHGSRRYSTASALNISQKGGQLNERANTSLNAAATETETTDYPVEKLIASIRTSGKLQRQVEELRETYRCELAQHGDPKRAKQASGEVKKQLPGALWSGTFTRRANEALVAHSGLLCADLDSLNGTLHDVREKLSKSPHVWVLFTSPSGDGLKAVFCVPADAGKHSGSYRAVEQHVRELTGIQIDQACKDVARLCFLSYDPGIYYNGDAGPIEPLPEPDKPRPVPNGAINLSERQRIAEEILGEVDWQSDTSGLVKCPGEDRHTNPNRKRDCTIYLDGVPNIHCFHGSCRGIREALEYTLQSRIGKIEYVPPVSSDSKKQAAELPQVPAPYVPPPLTLLPAPMREYVQAAAEAINVDIGYILLPLLSALGNAVGNARSILLKGGFIQPPII